MPVTYRWVDGTTATVPDARNAGATSFSGDLTYDTDLDMVVEWAFSQSRTKTWERYSGDWHQVSPAVSPPTSAFSPNGVAMAYDATRQEVLLTIEPSGVAAIETWTYNTPTWLKKTPSTVPTSSGQPQKMDWDPVNHLVVMVLYLAGVMKVWSWNGTNWTLRTITGTPPTARTSFGFRYFPPGGYFLFYGGQSPNSNDTWKLDITAGTWTQLTPATSPATSDSQVTWMAYNPLWGKIAMYTNTGQTWLWDGTDWEHILPSPDIPARAYFHLCFNAAEGRVMGYGGTLVSASFVYETWFLERIDPFVPQIYRRW